MREAAICIETMIDDLILNYIISLAITLYQSSISMIPRCFVLNILLWGVF